MADTTDNQTQDEWNEETVYGPSTVIAALDQSRTSWSPRARFPCRPQSW